MRALNGTTIQVIHSDAEGRMALADTLALAARGKPQAMLDFATLTGACVYALTERMSGLFANRRRHWPAAALAAEQSPAASGCGSSRCPRTSTPTSTAPIADVAQCAVEGKGDHILATRFLKRFVPKDMPWAHVDLSSATRRGGLAHVPTEITGFGARFALDLRCWTITWPRMMRHPDDCASRTTGTCTCATARRWRPCCRTPRRSSRAPS